MGQVVSTVIIVLLVILVFVPLAGLNAENDAVEEIKQSINLSARVLANCVRQDDEALAMLADGYLEVNGETTEVDMEKLLKEFDEMLRRNCNTQKRYDAVSGNLAARVLVCQDRLYIAGKDGRWSFPFFFTSEIPGIGEIYLQAGSDKAYIYEGVSRKYITLDEAGITPEQRDDLIIECINKKILSYTWEPARGGSIGIKIRNPLKTSLPASLEDSCFNVLEGTTFFVVYASDRNLDIQWGSFHYKNYNVTGYTLVK